jgi:DNA-binding response OmpR family regulator
MKKLVFIIDDDPVYLNFMKGHFKQMAEFETQVYLSGKDAIKALDDTKPFLIILDHLFLNDPDNTGLEYLKEIRKKTSRIPVIYITSIDEQILRSKTAKMKVVDYILKDDAFLIHLRTALDKLTKQPEKKSLLKKLFSK